MAAGMEDPKYLSREYLALGDMSYLDSFIIIIICRPRTRTGIMVLINSII